MTGSRSASLASVAALLALSAVALALNSCGTSSASLPESGRLIVATSRPAADAAAVLTALEPAARYPAGSRIVVLDATRPGEAPRVLSDELAAAGGPAVDHEASLVAFVGQERAGERFQVYTCAPDGSGLRRAVDHPTDCGSVTILPDGRLCFAAVLPGRSPVAGERAWGLYVAPGDGAAGARITFGGGIDVDPHVLRDGRVAYSTYLPGDPGRYAVFTVHTDGTGVAPLLGERGDPQPRVRVTQAADGLLYLSSAEGVAAARWADPQGRAPGLVDAVRDAGWAAGTPAGGVLLARDGAIEWRADPGAVGEAVEPPPGERLVEAVALAPRRRPQGHLSMVKPEKGEGLLVAMDARHAGAAGGAAVRARLSRLPPGAGLSREGALPLGDLTLAADGSFSVRVPPDTALLLDLVDVDGRVVVAGRTPFWVRPNEARVCVGCHEPPDVAPPNRRPLTLLDDPVDLTGRASPEDGR